MLLLYFSQATGKEQWIHEIDEGLHQADQLPRVGGARSAAIKIRNVNIQSLRQSITLGLDVSKHAILIEE
jgi:hypothetical protein